MIPSSKPRVQASGCVDPMTIESGGGEFATTPSVAIVVEFDLHDHERALTDLKDAYDYVVNQIAQVL